MDPPRLDPMKPSRWRTPVAVLIGLAGCLAIWLAAPYNDYVIAAVSVNDSYLPVAAMFLMLMLVLVVNPALRLVSPGRALDRHQLAIIVGMLLIGCVLPGFGMLGILPYSLANVAPTANQERLLSDTFAQMNLPAGLFPDRLGYGLRTPNSDAFLTDLRPGQALPWAAWLGPLLTWGAFLGFAWLMMTGLALIVFPQWRRNERLSFPLLAVEQEFIGDPAGGRLLPPLLCLRSFWAAALVVFLLHFLNGAKVYFPESVPAVSLNWDVQHFFTEGMWRRMPWTIVQGRIYFIFIGIAFFVPNRVAVSVWFFTIAYAFYRMIVGEYFPPGHGNVGTDHRLGAALALSVMILWIGRRRWADVLGSLFRRGGGESAGRDRRSAAMFLAGFAGMWGWLTWAGLGPGWALALAGWGFMTALLITRLVAETGIPFVRLHMGKQISLVKLMPMPWIGPAAVFFAWISLLIFNFGSRVSFAAMATHAIGLDEPSRPRRQWRLGYLLLATVLLGLVVCGAAHLWTTYHYAQSLDGRSQPLDSFGVTALDPAYADLRDCARGHFARQSYNQPAHIAFGAGLAALLYVLCLASPTWPIHPIGMLLVETSYSQQTWASFLIGWLLKGLIVRFGGSRLYQKTRPIFFGLIAGEIFAAVFWGLLPAVLAWLGISYRYIQIVP